jgi:hypothetical protein
VEAGGSKRMPWMNGLHGGKTPLLLKKDKRKGFKGAGEMPKICMELRVWQKGYQQKPYEPLALPDMGLNSLRKFLSRGLKNGKQNPGRG